MATEQEYDDIIAPLLAAIAAERQRQVSKGYDAAHDDVHQHGEILWADWGAIARINDAMNTSAGSTEHYKKLLTQAAAQIVAEIERVDRAALAITDGSTGASR